MEVLQAVNQNEGVRAAEVADIVGIPRPTAYRLLETLGEMGFVVRGPSDENWRPTLRTKLLSSGFNDEHGVAQIAVPRMSELCRRILWPIDLVIFRDYSMVIRETTHNISPYSICYATVGDKIPMAESAAGRAYLAFAPREDRLRITAKLSSERGKARVEYQDEGPLDRILDRTKLLGVGFRVRGLDGRTISLSAPILGKDRPWACLTIIMIASAITFEKAIATYRAPLLSTAASISEELSRLGEDNGTSNTMAYSRQMMS